MERLSFWMFFRVVCTIDRPICVRCSKFSSCSLALLPPSRHPPFPKRTLDPTENWVSSLAGYASLPIWCLFSKCLKNQEYFHFNHNANLILNHSCSSIFSLCSLSYMREGILISLLYFFLRSILYVQLIPSPSFHFADIWKIYCSAFPQAFLSLSPLCFIYSRPPFFPRLEQKTILGK